MSDYRLECTLLGGPWPNRLPITSVEEQQAATRLLGAALTLVIPGPADPAGGREPWATRATVPRISPGEPRSQRALLRLDAPLVDEECAYSYAVAYLRCDGESLDRLVTAGEFFCSVKGLPVEQVESATPFDHHRWPAGAPRAAALRLPCGCYSLGTTREFLARSLAGVAPRSLYAVAACSDKTSLPATLFAPLQNRWPAARIQN